MRFPWSFMCRFWACHCWWDLHLLSAKWQFSVCSGHSSLDLPCTWRSSFNLQIKKLLIELMAISWGWRFYRGRGKLIVRNIWRLIKDCAGELRSLLFVATLSPFCFSWATDILRWGLCELSPHLPPSWSSLFCFFSYEILLLFLMSLVPILHSFITVWNYSDFIIKLCTVSFFLCNDIPQSRVQCLHKNLISNNLQQICCRDLYTLGDHPVCLLPLGFFWTVFFYFCFSHM